jgi:hypothetical protein
MTWARRDEQEVEPMSGPKTNGKNPRQEARMVVHEDEHAIIKAMLWKALGDDDCFGMFVSSVRSESGRAEDRLVLARFLERMERHFQRGLRRLENLKQDQLALRAQAGQSTGAAPPLLPTPAQEGRARLAAAPLVVSSV